MIYISKLVSHIPTSINAGDINVGATVKINESGKPVDYLVVHQGLPGSMYDVSCDGTWLLRKDLLDARSSGGEDYAHSSMNTYLNGDFYNLFDESVKSSIKQSKIPYRAGEGFDSTITSGANGLSVKIFLPSATELDVSSNFAPPNEGAPLSYFSGGGNEKRIAYMNGDAQPYSLRSPNVSPLATFADYIVIISGDGASSIGSSYAPRCPRPAFILPFDFKFSEKEVA